MEMNLLMSDATTTAAELQAAIDGQSARRLELLEHIRGPVIDGGMIRLEGDQVVMDPGQNPGDRRVVLWISRLLLHGSEDDQQLANTFLLHVQLTHACHFCGVCAMTLLASAKEKLDPSVVALLEEHILSCLSDWMTDDYRFHGANDNAPMGCTTIVALAGEYFGRDGCMDFARRRFGDLERLLDLRGYIHECNSPTYAGISLVAIADLAEWINDPALKATALRIEQRLWQEILLHLHPVIRHHIGPFSRGYSDDNANQCSVTMMTLWAAFGEISPYNPISMLFPPPDGTFAHNGGFHQYAQSCAQASATYHPPIELATVCLNRSFPFEVSGNNEFMAIGAAPAGDTNVHVHARPRWAMSSFGSRVWAGQTVPLHLLYHRREVSADTPVEEHLQLTRSVYTRSEVSDKFTSMQPIAQRAEAIEQEILTDHSAAFVVQHEGAALLGYVPICNAGPIRTIRSSIVFPLHHSRPEEVWHGSTRLPSFSASFSETAWAFIRDGDIYLALHPLVAKQTDAMLCSQQYIDYGPYATVSCYNMCGFDPIELDDRQLRQHGSGFVVEISVAGDWPSFEAFRDAFSSSSISQRNWGTERELRYQRGDIDLELKYDFNQLNLRRAASNNSTVSTGTKLTTEPPLPLID
jgi:hypothetical protein